MKKLLLATALTVATFAPAHAGSKALGVYMVQAYETCKPGTLLPEASEMLSAMFNMMDADVKREALVEWRELKSSLNNNEKMICLMLDVAGADAVAEINRIARDTKRKMSGR